MGALQCGKMPGDFKVPKFSSTHSDQDVKSVADTIAPGADLKKVKNISAYTLECSGMVFNDVNFETLDSKITTSNKLSKLFDYKRQNIDRLYSAGNSSQNLINQKQVELAYSSAVIYQIGKHQELKENIVLTRHVNKYHAYVVKLFCNGLETIVAVDDNVPVQKNQISFINVTNGKELWPLLVEKAWVKQIGEYEKARGLSPQDCFEEITGIPAYSFLIKDQSFHHNQNLFRSFIKYKYWVALTGHITDREIKSRQIFVVEDFDPTDNSFTIRSPYQTFDIRGVDKKNGAVSIKLQKIMQIFQYATVGYYKAYHELTSLTISSSKQQQILVQINVEREDEINLRFVQFYSEYFNSDEKIFYQYSPLCMELYDGKKQLIESCQGIPQILEGVRSSHINKEIFVKLGPGTYYLRLQINWINQKQLNTGNIVAYSSPNNVKMTKINSQQSKKLLNQLLINSVQTEEGNKIVKDSQDIIVRWVEKLYRYLICIQNLSSQNCHLRIKFKGSENIRINHQQGNNETIEFVMKGNEIKCLQIVPADPHQAFQLAPFDIIKL